MGIVIAYLAGLIEPLFLNDFTYITSMTTILFLVCWATTFRRIIGTSHSLNMVKSWKDTKKAWTISKATEEKTWAKVAWLRDVSNWLVGLGLIGTIVGFRYALSGVETTSMGSAQGVSGAIGPLMAGMRIALNTTIVGAIFGMWNEVNQRMLRTALSCLLADCKEQPPR